MNRLATVVLAALVGGLAGLWLLWVFVALTAQRAPMRRPVPDPEAVVWVGVENATCSPEDVAELARRIRAELRQTGTWPVAHGRDGRLLDVER